MPEAAKHLAPPSLGQRVIDRHHQRLLRPEQTSDDQLRDPAPKLIDRPARGTEEPVRASVMPDPGEPATGQHPADGTQRRLRDLADNHRPERLKRRARETWREQEQKLIQRRWNAEHRRQPPVGAADRAATRPRHRLWTPTSSGKPPLLLPRTSAARPLSRPDRSQRPPPTWPSRPRPHPAHNLKSAKAEFQPNAAGCAGPRWFGFGASSEAASVPGCAGVRAGGASCEPGWRRRPPTGPR